MPRIYKVVLIFKVPNALGDKLDFRTLYNDICYGIQEFNKRFKNIKEVKLNSINTQDIELLFSIDIQNEGKNSDHIVNARDLSVLSKRLNRDRGWSIYSRENTKLFTAKIFEDVTNKCQSYDELQVIPKDLIANIMKDLNQDINSRLSDASTINAFQGLITIQDIGDTEIRTMRKESILEIKRILL